MPTPPANIRRILTHALETQAFPLPDSGASVTICRHPISHCLDIPTATAAGRLIQWTTPNHSNGASTFLYTLTNEGTLVIASANPIAATDYLSLTSWGIASTVTDSCLQLRHLELTVEHTGPVSYTTPGISSLTLVVNLLLVATASAITIPIRMSYSGQAVFNHITIPEGYTFTSATITATTMASLRITANMLAHPVLSAS